MECPQTVAFTAPSGHFLVLAITCFSYLSLGSSFSVPSLADIKVGHCVWGSVSLSRTPLKSTPPLPLRNIMARLFRVFALFLVLVVCLTVLATSLPIKEVQKHSSGESAVKTVSPTGSGQSAHTSLSRKPRGLGFGLGYYPYYPYGYGGYYPRPTLLGTLLFAKRRLLGSKYSGRVFTSSSFANQFPLFSALGGLFRPRPWGYYGYY